MAPSAGSQNTELAQNLDYMIKFSTNWSKLPLGYVGVCTTIRCVPITHGFAKGYTFISMDGEYTTDCNPGMLRIHQYTCSSSTLD